MHDFPARFGLSPLPTFDGLLGLCDVPKILGDSGDRKAPWEAFRGNNSLVNFEIDIWEDLRSEKL